MSGFTLKRLVRLLNVLVIVIFAVRAISPLAMSPQFPAGDATDQVFLPFVQRPIQALRVPTPTSPPGGPELSFACLDQPGPLQTVTGFYHETKFEPSVAANKKFDARGASF
ncbi:MAG TPA: hypothetical protein PKE45_08215, partial [Caldilineaceae bacterium]|nr:hypothetical protein [Caldilineaceae bacterium]